MRQILHGIRIFQHRVFPVRRQEFERLAGGQQPHTLLITCSDSRIVPELLTQSLPGELFVSRNAGNLVPPWDEEHPGGEAATVEFAVEVLKVQHVVVCGHSDCGAMKGLLKPESVTKLPAVRGWLKYAGDTRQKVSQSMPDGATDQECLTEAIKTNVQLQLEHLRTYPAVAAAESRGELALHGWFYQFESGEVSQINEQTGEFLSILDVLTRDVSVA